MFNSDKVDVVIDVLCIIIYYYLLCISHKKQNTGKNAHKNREKTYKIHIDSNIKSISVALKPGCVYFILLFLLIVFY